jgi:hypothetical protein
LIAHGEGAFQSDSGLAEGAFFEEAADEGYAVRDAAGRRELGERICGIRRPVAAGFGDFDESGTEGKGGMAGEVRDGEHFIAERRDEQDVYLGEDASHFLSDFTAEAIGLHEIDGREEAGLAEQIGPSVGDLDLQLIEASAEGEFFECGCAWRSLS